MHKAKLKQIIHIVDTSFGKINDHRKPLIWTQWNIQFWTLSN